MNWYIAKLVFRILNESETLQYDEQIRLVKAFDQNEAVEKAEEIGRANEDEFLSKDNHNVYWKFEGIANLYPLQNLEHGVELYSTIVEKTAADNYSKNIKLRHREITQNLVAEI